MAIRTFPDSGVLLAAHRGEPAIREACLAILKDQSRFFIASPFLFLETMPKALYHKNQGEVELYKTYFDSAHIWINDVDAIVSTALEESERCGLAAMDALHVAAASLAEADVLYTLERTNKPIHRTKLVGVVSI